MNDDIHQNSTSSLFLQRKQVLGTVFISFYFVDVAIVAVIIVYFTLCVQNCKVYVVIAKNTYNKYRFISHKQYTKFHGDHQEQQIIIKSKLQCQDFEVFKNHTKCGRRRFQMKFGLQLYLIDIISIRLRLRIHINFLL